MGAPIIGCSKEPPVRQHERSSDMVNRDEMVAAHRELVEASDAVRHLLVVEDLTTEKIREARSRLERAYTRVTAADDEMLLV